jgi:hypothetical protein
MCNPLIIKDNQSLAAILNVQQTSAGYDVSNANLNLLFDPQTQVVTKKIHFSNSSVTIQNMKIFGSLVFDKCNVVISNSTISSDETQKDFVISADNSTTFVAFNLKVDAKTINSILVDRHSTGTFTNCEFSNFKIAAKIQNESKAFFLNCSVKNTQNIPNSQFLNISNQSHVQILDCTFEKCSENGIEVSTNSFINISHCNFGQFEKCLGKFTKESSGLIHNCNFNNSNTSYYLLYFDQSKCDCYHCSFLASSIQISNNSSLKTDNCLFENYNLTPIQIENSNAAILNSKFINIEYDGVLNKNGSKTKIFNSDFEKCRNGIYSWGNSELDAIKCRFLNMKQYSIFCYDSAQVNLESCTLLDPQKGFFSIYRKGSINVNSSKLKQSNSSIQFSEIDKTKGKIAILNSSIEWKGNLDCSTVFENASLANLKNNNFMEEVYQIISSKKSKNSSSSIF